MSNRLYIAGELVFIGAWMLWGYPFGNLANAVLALWAWTWLSDFYGNKNWGK